MEKKEILEKVAPCSLICCTCSGYEKGIICESAKNLLHYLKGIKEFYEKHMPGVVKDYTNFEGILTMYSSAPCRGCRSGEHNGCSIGGCFILECSKEHGVDFCGECDEFPCKKVSDLFEEEVYKQWLNGNQQIKDNGIECFVLKNCDRPHYEIYKKF